MTKLTGLKLVASTKQRSVSPNVYRRRKLASRLAQQKEMVQAVIDGRTYTETQQHYSTDPKTGERVLVERQRRPMEWFWQKDDSSIHFALRYGAKVVELAKGKNAIEVGSWPELLTAIDVLATAVNDGELDNAIGAVSTKVRAGFHKKT